MAIYLLAVYSPPESRARLEEFNVSLGEQAVFIGGLHEDAATVTAHVQGTLGDGPLHPESAQPAGMWIIRAATRTQAEALALRASAASGQDVELREFHQPS